MKKIQTIATTSTIKSAFLASLPVLAGYLVLGIGFGMVLKNAGFGVGWAFSMSAFIYAGSIQFVTVDLMTTGASLITVALTTLMVNARHLFYGITMIERYRNTGAAKPYLIFTLTDETFSLVCDDKLLPAGVTPKQFYLWVSLFDHCYWVMGSVLGSLLATIFAINTTGIDFALTALFVSTFVEQWLSHRDHLPALIGVGISVLCLLIFDNFLIPSMLGITLALSAVHFMPQIRKANPVEEVPADE